MLIATGDLASQLFNGLVFVFEVADVDVNDRSGHRSLLESFVLFKQSGDSLVYRQLVQVSYSLIAEIAGLREPCIFEVEWTR